MPKILVVDDAAFMRMRCAKLLSENGYEVVEAGNGVEAIQKYREIRPDAVLLDITMPEMDGIETLKKTSRGRCWGQSRYGYRHGAAVHGDRSP